MMKNNFVTADRTAEEIVNHFAGSHSDLISAIQLWAKLKHKSCRYRAIDIVQDYNQKRNSDPDYLIDIDGILKDIQNIKF